MNPLIVLYEPNVQHQPTYLGVKACLRSVKLYNIVFQINVIFLNREAARIQ